MTAEITITDEHAHALTPEGQTFSMPLTDLIEIIRPDGCRTSDVPLPPGIAYVRSLGNAEIWVHQTPPQLWNLRWICRPPEALSQPQSRQQQNEYRDVVIALPYIITLAAFCPRDLGCGLTISNSNECFFRNEPLHDSRSDELYVPALLNCSLFKLPEKGEPIGVHGRPAVWICTQYLDRRRFELEENERRRMVLGFQTLMTMLLGAGFNYSSEMHEITSGYSASRDVDPRLATIEEWQKASADDPQFVLSVPWRKTGYTVEEVVERMFRHLNATRANVRTADDLAGIICRHHAKQRLSERRRRREAVMPAQEDVS